MRFSSSYLLPFIAALSPLASAEKVIESNSLNSCRAGSNFTATLFNVAFTPGNRSIGIDINGVSSIVGNVTAKIEIIAYGFTILNQTLDPCTMGFSGFCPMEAGRQINIETNLDVPESLIKSVPGVAYSVPDLDGVVRIYVNERETGRPLACMEADLTNTKSVYQKAVGWATAIIAGLGLVASGITSGMGHTNTAAHVAANAVSLFGFFQAQAIIGMTSVTMPPIVQSWTQNFQWSMGIIRVGFLQQIATWYQRATGGTPTTYLSTLSTYSVQVQKRALKRSIEALTAAATQGIRAFAKRQDNTSSSAGEVKIVRGIDRVGFRAGIEQTNIFMTGLIFFVAVLFFVTVAVALTKAIIEGCAKAGWMKSDKFSEFRKGWKIVIKGILFRLVLLGFVQMSVLCLWELVERDSAAEVVLALVVFLSMGGALAWASYKVIQLAKKSVAMHKNPGYILYSDPECLNKWGFLYVQYKATSYYFVVALLVYILCKAVFIAFAQKSPVAQAVGLVVVEAVALIGISVYRPFMDKKTNIFNISIAAVNFLNAVFLLVFSNAFGQPEMVSGIMGVLFAFYNIVFAAVLLVMVLVASIYAICSKNPEVRYQPMRDDRGSFIKSQQALTTELDALGVTARGDQKAPFGQAKTIDDDDSMSSESLNKHPEMTQTRPYSGQYGYGSGRSVDNVPLTEQNSRQDQQEYSHGQPQIYQQHSYNNSDYSYNERNYDRGYDRGYGGGRPGTAPQQNSYDYNTQQHNTNNYTQPPRSAHGGYPPQRNYRQQNNSSPWQRGAGYD